MIIFNLTRITNYALIEVDFVAQILNVIILSTYKLKKEIETLI
ncbi:MAG: hypothetical protein A370_01676 [Clostridium sp. Maddingley MBC34-26]|nr:MAG: hypothetical protein A370_01676 [Clostridium sp. Maddingley MBC34-26]